jgi:hypothetical protein
MGRPRKPSANDFDDSEFFADKDFDLQSFMDQMESKDSTGGAKRREKARRASIQRLDDYQESRWLREQLQDWDDWEKG